MYKLLPCGFILHLQCRHRLHCPASALPLQQSSQTPLFLNSTCIWSAPWIPPSQCQEVSVDKIVMQHMITENSVCHNFFLAVYKEELQNQFFPGLYDFKFTLNEIKQCIASKAGGRWHFLYPGIAKCQILTRIRVCSGVSTSPSLQTS